MLLLLVVEGRLSEGWLLLIEGGLRRLLEGVQGGMLVLLCVMILLLSMLMLMLLLEGKAAEPRCSSAAAPSTPACSGSLRGRARRATPSDPEAGAATTSETSGRRQTVPWRRRLGAQVVELCEM